MILSQRLSSRNMVLVVALCCMIVSRASATVHTVSVGNFFFTPAKTHVVHGDTVRWVWSSGFHNSSSDASSPKQWLKSFGVGSIFPGCFSSADGNGPPYSCHSSHDDEGHHLCHFLAVEVMSSRKCRDLSGAELSESIQPRDDNQVYDPALRASGGEYHQRKRRNRGKQ
jgi:hypothetical protein